MPRSPAIPSPAGATPPTSLHGWQLPMRRLPFEPGRAGSSPRLGAPLASVALVLGILGALALGPDSLQGQVPPIPPIPPVTDTLPPPAADTIPAPPADPDDPDFESVRQVLPRNLPHAGASPDPGFERGVWAWDREALLATSALTLHDLLSFVPGVTMVRGGDLGTPVAITALGAGGGQIRVFLDGVEDAPLEGGVVDLQQVGLTGLEEVRIERGVGEIRIHLTSQRVEDGRPLTTLEVGTGDFRTNVFRVGFLHPNALGGTLLVALDRADTDGPAREEPGAVFGTRFRYSLFRGEALGLALEYRSRTARRPEETYQPREVDRSEWSARLGWRPTDGLLAEFHGVRATASLGERAAPEADSLLPGEARGSVGARLTYIPADPLRVWAAASRHTGEGWPASRFEVGGTATLPGVGGVTGRWDREGWSELARTGRESALDPAEDGSAVGWSIQGWTEPRFGVSLFAEAGRTQRGLPFVVPADRVRPPLENGDNGETPGNGDPDEDDPGDDEDEEDPPGEEPDPEVEPVPFDPVRFHAREGVRVGARLQWQGASLSGAWVRVETDALPPFALPFDRDGLVLPGGVRSGVEVEGRVPLNRLRRGLELAGTGQFWATPEGEDPWRYLPERSWTGELRWYHEGYDGRLEVWADVGVRGRDPMLVPLPLPEAGEGPDEPVLFQEAPYTQSWFARLQFRVVTVRVFVHWENLAFRQENADLPGRVQPQTRAMYGIRWTMWN